MCNSEELDAEWDEAYVINKSIPSAVHTQVKVVPPEADLVIHATNHMANKIGH